MGNWQTEQKNANRLKVIGVLSDGQQHQFGEILEKTKLSRPILTIHLKELLRKGLVEKKEGEKDSRTTFYKATPTLMSGVYQTMLTAASCSDIKREFSKTRDLSKALEMVDGSSDMNLLTAFANFKTQNLDFSDRDVVRSYLDIFVWEPYKILTWNLVETSREFINDIDLEKTMRDLIHSVRSIKNEEHE
jgi:DNA-binding transcriptional ArsR family regulator